MVTPFDRAAPRVLHPLHAALLAGTVPLFLGALPLLVLEQVVDEWVASVTANP